MKLYQYLCLAIILAWTLPVSITAQSRPDSVIQWKSIEEVIKLRKTDPRPVMTFFYMPGHDTSMLMLENILMKRELVNYVNPSFYPVKINVADTLLSWFNGKSYHRNDTSIINDLIPHVLGNGFEYPSFLFLNRDSSGIAFKGFRSRYEMRCLLAYIAEEVDRTTPYHLWFQAYRVAYPVINMPDTLRNPIQWLTLEEALAKQKKNPKNLYITWYKRLNISSQVMLFNAFNHPKITEYMSKNFYCVRLDAKTADSLYWDKRYYAKGTENEFHDLAMLQLDNKMIFPAHLFYGKDSKLILRQHSYLGIVNFYALVNYIGSQAYKSKSLKEYIRSFKPDL